MLCKRQSRWLFSLSQVFNDSSKLLRIFFTVHRCSLDFFLFFSRRNANSTFTFIVSSLFLQSSSITRARGLWFWISACDLLCAFSTIATVILLLQQYNKQEVKIGQLHLTVFAGFSQSYTYEDFIQEQKKWQSTWVSHWINHLTDWFKNVASFTPLLCVSRRFTMIVILLTM